MSYTELFAIKKDVAIKKEFKNAFRGAMYVWSDIAKRYAGFDVFPFDYDDQMEVWNYHYRHPNVMKEHEAIVMLSTMDNAMVEANQWERLVKAFEQYGLEHPNSNYYDQANAIKELVEQEGIENIIGFAWNQTSINSVPWFITEEYVEELDDYVDHIYNPDESSNHFWVFEQWDTE